MAAIDISEYKPSELKTALEIINGVSLSGMPEGCRGNLGSISEWFRSRGLKSQVEVMSLNEKQNQLVDSTLTSEDTHKHPVAVVNAGPGTGKTSTITHLCSRFRGKVLVISYSNEAINEIYLRMKIFPGTRGVLGKKDFSKRIVISTIDSLAAFVLKKPFDNYEEDVKDAIFLLRNSKCKQLFSQGKGSLFDMIIVDEAQDIDNIRATLLFEVLRVAPPKRTMIFGDPRQRLNIRAGEWFQDMWRGQYQNWKEDLLRIGFDVCYRFKNKHILDTSNALSATRESSGGSLHVELVPGCEMFECLASDSLILRGIEETVSIIKETGSKLSEWCIIAPSVFKNNYSSAAVNRLVDGLVRSGIRAYTRCDGAFVPNAIFVSTIHGIKGKEFDHVIMVGMESFPAYHTMISKEEADSLIYVSHTRARICNYYFVEHLERTKKAEFIYPRGIRGSNPVPKVGRQEQYQQESVEGYSVDFFETREYQRFSETNRMTELTSGNTSSSLAALSFAAWVLGETSAEIKTSDGTKLVTSKFSLERWKYHIRAYISILKSVKRVSEILSLRGLRQYPIKEGTYFVDTEFTPPTPSMPSEIFDIALINGNDPYRSVVQPASVRNMFFACKWLSAKPEMFQCEFSNVIDIFRSAVYPYSPTLEHYVAQNDVSWAQKAFEGEEFNTLNLSTASKQKASEIGVTSGGSQPPILSELYSVLVKPVQMTDLVCHNAVCDALMLYEMRVLGLLLP